MWHSVQSAWYILANEGAACALPVNGPQPITKRISPANCFADGTLQSTVRTCCYRCGYCEKNVNSLLCERLCCTRCSAHPQNVSISPEFRRASRASIDNVPAASARCAYPRRPHLRSRPRPPHTPRAAPSTVRSSAPYARWSHPIEDLTPPAERAHTTASVSSPSGSPRTRDSESPQPAWWLPTADRAIAPS